jgi:uncharacterized protein YcbK (DUF882 family)
MSLRREGGLIEGKELSRRRFLRLGAVAAGTLILPHRGLAAIQDPPVLEKSLSFYEIHTREHLTTAYWAEGRYLPESLDDINHILRDWRNNEIKSIDTGLLDLVHAIGVKLEAKEPFHIISGYRSPQTTEQLCQKGRGVAKNSLHLCGKAIDLRLPGCGLSVLRDVAVNMKAGGVGCYPGPNFIHIDVGRVRYW